MITFSIVLFVAALISAINILLNANNVSGDNLFVRIAHLFTGEVDFGARLSQFFSENVFSANKIALYLFVIFVIVGVILLIRGLRKAKDEAAAEKSFDTRALKYVRGLKSEMTKIVWPTAPTVVRNTLATLSFCLVVGVIIVAIDLGLAQLIKLLLSLGS